MLVITSGAHRVDTAAVAGLLGVDQPGARRPGPRPRRAPASRSAASRRSAIAAPLQTLVDVTLAGTTGLGRRRPPAHGLPDHVRRAGPAHRRPARRGGLSCSPTSGPTRPAGHPTLWGVPPARDSGRGGQDGAGPRHRCAACRARGSPSCSAPATAARSPLRDADPRHWGLLASWDDARRPPRSSRCRTHRGWDRLADERLARPDLRPLTSRGRWSRRRAVRDPEPRPRRTAPSRPITRARLRPRGRPAFWRAVPPVSADLHRSPGLRAGGRHRRGAGRAAGHVQRVGSARTHCSTSPTGGAPHVDGVRRTPRAMVRRGAVRPVRRVSTRGQLRRLRRADPVSG